MKTLQLYFLTEQNKKVLLSVDMPEDNVSAATIEAAMQVIMQSDAFEIDGAALTAIHSARVVERTVTNLLEV